MKADTQTKADVLAGLRRYWEAYGRRDVHAVMAEVLPDEDVIYIGTGADEILTGAAAIREHIQRDWGQSDSVEMELSNERVSAEGDVAWVSADLAVHVKTVGEAFTMRCRQPAVFVRREDRWLLAQGHLSVPFAAQGEGRSFPMASEELF